MLLCIDFQPAYIEAFGDLVVPLKQRLGEATQSGEEVHFIYNDVRSLEGEELGDSLADVLEWGAQEGMALDLGIELGRTRLIQKNFGWVSHLFRSGRERAVAVTILRYLMKSGLSSSAEIPSSQLERIVADAHDDFAGFWDCSPEAWEEMKTGAIAMPFLFEGGMIPWLESIKGAVVEVTGGFRHRCLDEFCITMEAAEISYFLNDALIYSLPEEASEPVERYLECEVRAPLLFPAVDLVSA
jgi:hypothetical protein